MTQHQAPPPLARLACAVALGFTTVLLLACAPSEVEVTIFRDVTADSGLGG